jgi:hypothetical protein
MTENNSVGDNKVVDINLKWFVQIMVVVGIAVWGYFGLTERLNFLEHNLTLAQVNVDMNSEFRVTWPRGELGALPDDAEQNMRLDMLEKVIDRRTAKLEQLMEDFQRMKFRAEFNSINNN